MRRRAVFLWTLLAACSSDESTTNNDSSSGGSSTSSSSGGSSASSSSSGGVMGAGPKIPQAQGDPCRGVALPDTNHYVPSGMCARMVASGVGGLRQITFAPNGDLFGQTANGAIWRFHDADGDGTYATTEVTKYATTDGNGNNVHIDVAGGFLYAGSTGGVKRFTYSPTATTGGAGEDVIVNQPVGAHPKHTVHIWDGWLYLQSGSASNAISTKAPEYDDTRSFIKRFEMSTFKSGTPWDFTTDGEIVTKGLRNPNGFARTAAGKIFAVVNGLDDIHYGGKDVHIDNPGEQVLEIAAGKAYGYPYCFTAQRVVNTDNTVVAPGTQLVNVDYANGHDDAWCAANSSKPTTFIQAHSAPLDITFFELDPKGALPEKWRGGAFVALHGSWDRSPATGYKVIWIPFDAQGNAPMPTSTTTTTTFPYEVVFGGGSSTAGAKDGSWSWAQDPYSEAPRPAGVAISPIDGALYITSDAGGYLYRVGLKQ